MKTLFLMRHGDAPQAKHDAERMLSKLGRAQCRSVAQKISHANIGKCLTSDYQRAIESASELCSALNIQIELNQTERLRPTASLNAAVNLICEQLDILDDGALLVVFHLPIISEVASMLIDGNMHKNYAFPVASVLELTTDIPVAGLFKKVTHHLPEC